MNRTAIVLALALLMPLVGRADGFGLTKPAARLSYQATGVAVANATPARPSWSKPVLW